MGRAGATTFIIINIFNAIQNMRGMSDSSQVEVLPSETRVLGQFSHGSDTS